MLCEDLLVGRLKERYDATPTPLGQMRPVGRRLFGKRCCVNPASLFATRGCNHRYSIWVSPCCLGPPRSKPRHVLEHGIEQFRELCQKVFLQFTDDTVVVLWARNTMGVMAGSFCEFVAAAFGVKLYSVVDGWFR